MKKITQIISLVLVLMLTISCVWRINKMHPLVRSDVIKSEEQIKDIVSKARLELASDGRTRLLFVTGTPYERGFQQGVLLKEDIQDNITYIYESAVNKYGTEELFDEAFERMRPFIPEEYMEEMHGLAHGAQIPLRLVHAFHSLPSITEWGGKKEIVNTIKKMFLGELGTSCSNFNVCDGATADRGFYSVRILDWGLHRISRAHEYPLITVSVPEKGLASANIGWAGFVGAVSGMNEAGITLGEMGYRNPPGETLRGKPMPFLLRDVLTYAHNLPEVQKIIKESPGDCSFVYLMSDGKAKKSEFYIRDPSRFLVFTPDQPIVDGEEKVEPIPNTLYAGHYNDKMKEVLTKKHGQLTPEVIMKEVIPEFVMPSNFQNVVYDPVNLKFWVSNAKSATEPAAQQPYLEFDFARELKKFRELK